MNPMPNRAMEFHDSKFDGFDQDGTNLTLRFSAAYIHESDSERGLDVGIDWVQDVRERLNYWIHVSIAMLFVGWTAFISRRVQTDGPCSA
jgi:hypothetical protein